MSVMTPADFRNPNRTPVDMNGRPIGRNSIQLAATPPPDLQRQAVIDQLAPPTAGASPRGGAAPGAPTTGGASPFNRGGKVTQLPSNGTAGKLGNLGVGVGAQVAGQLASNVGKNIAKKGVESVASKVAGNTGSLVSGAANLGAGMGIGIGADVLANKLRDKEEMPTFGGEFGGYTDELGRRFQGTGGGMLSNAVKYAGVGGNPALAASTMGLSVLGGAAAGAIKGAIQKHAKSAYSDFAVEDAANAIKAQYKAELGREASDEEVQAHLVNQGWDPKGGDRWVGEKGLTGKGGVMDAIRNSPEAAEFARTGKSQIDREALVNQLGASGAPTAAPDLAGRGGAEVPGSAPAPPLGTGTGPSGAIETPTGTPTAAGEDAAPPADSSTWDTDGYAAPAYTPPAAGAAPPGWDAEKWGNKDHQTPKYAVGRILSNFPPTVEGLGQAFTEIEKAYPGATFNGKDKITLPGIGEYDVLQGASKGGEAWRWDDLSVSGGGGEPASGGGASAGGGLAATGDLGADGDLLAKLQAEIERIQKGEPDRNALMSQMGGGA